MMPVPVPVRARCGSVVGGRAKDTASRFLCFGRKDPRVRLAVNQYAVGVELWTGRPREKTFVCEM